MSEFRSPLWALIMVWTTAGGHAELWTRGGAVQIAVDFETFAQSVMVPPSLSVENSANSTLRLESLPPTLHCHGAWIELVPIGSAIAQDGTDSRLGAYDQIEMHWTERTSPKYDPSPASGTTSAQSVAFTTTVRYFSAVDVFHFVSEIGPDGCTNASVPDSEQPSPFEFWAATLPLSQFPRWKADGKSWVGSLDAGYVTWTGRFANDHSTHGLGLSGYHGGQEGGPLVLFDARIAQTTLTVPAVVLSPGSDFHDAILGIAPLSPTPPPCTRGEQCQLVPNVDFEGNDILPARRNVTSPEACCALCVAEPSCTCFSWLNTPGYTDYCALKTSTAGRTPNAGHVSGIKCNGPPPAPSAPAGLAGGFHGHLDAVPSGTSVTFVLAASRDGIRAALVKWGDALRQQYGTERLAPDAVTSKLGWWTDNGGYYDDSNRPNTSELATVLRGLAAAGVQPGYLQLDPYWYPDGSASSCAEALTPDPARFGPADLTLTELRAAVGVPLLLYSSYLCANNTQNERNYPGVTFITTRDFDVGWAHGNLSVPSGGTSFAFYHSVMAHFDKALAGGGWEVDFLDFIDLLFPNHTRTLGATRAWGKGMADAALQQSISIQYCMTLPANLLASLEYPAVTSARASEDNFPGSGASSGRWKIGYGALLMWPLRLRPFLDVIWTREREPGAPYNAPRSLVELQAIVATLSAGPVGIGDGPNMTNHTLVGMIAGADGVLLHPSEPATPIDAMFFPSGTPGRPATGEVWSTQSTVSAATQNGNTSLRVWTVLAVDVTTPLALKFSQFSSAVRPSDRFVVSYLSPRCRNGDLATVCTETLQGGEPLVVSTAPPTGVELGHQLYQVAPVLPSGWCVLGDTTRFVPMSPSRVVSVVDAGVGGHPGPTVTLAGAPGETVRIQFVQLKGFWKDTTSVQEVTVTLDSAGSGTASPLPQADD